MVVLPESKWKALGRFVVLLAAAPAFAQRTEVAPRGPSTPETSTRGRRDPDVEAGSAWGVAARISSRTTWASRPPDPAGQRPRHRNRGGHRRALRHEGRRAAGRVVISWRARGPPQALRARGRGGHVPQRGGPGERDQLSWALGGGLQWFPSKRVERACRPVTRRPGSTTLLRHLRSLRLLPGVASSIRVPGWRGASILNPRVLPARGQPAGMPAAAAARRARRVGSPARTQPGAARSAVARRACGMASSLHRLRQRPLTRDEDRRMTLQIVCSLVEGEARIEPMDG